MHARCSREFPEFGPWAFASSPDDTKQQQADLRLFINMCLYLLKLLGCAIPPLDPEDLQAACKAIAGHGTKRQQGPVGGPQGASKLHKGCGNSGNVYKVQIVQHEV
ncbi:hypothetical protein, conserved [Eimeria necatrix]|uniref:Uncharacterized protein n=1 Tax=Eimeria necatrix TaxID=51315 RepID=U6N792_9EIME|nr:hypothetical protein, conserved [Eimeria necatrix]CDJ70525.1 hypothetical protein, conserved [Eimeria necatrix]